jgi:hypothetical protein
VIEDSCILFYVKRKLNIYIMLTFSSMVIMLPEVSKNSFQGRRVLITPNAKPSKELLKSLVVAAHGQVCNL